MNEILLILALVCALLAAFAEPYVPRVRIGWLAFAFYMASLLFGGYRH